MDHTHTQKNNMLVARLVSLPSVQQNLDLQLRHTVGFSHGGNRALRGNTDSWDMEVSVVKHQGCAGADCDNRDVQQGAFLRCLKAFFFFLQLFDVRSLPLVSVQDH